MAFTLLKVLLFLSIHQCTLGQVCIETRSVFREVPETFRFTYIEMYEEPCIIFCTVKTRTAVNVTTRMVQRYENVTLNVCCEGYTEDINHEGNGLHCKPVCDPPCQNGYCRKPNQCACEAGYALDSLDPAVCKPLCLEGCNIPYCISTKSPQCFSNDSSESVTEAPYCTQPCINGICVGPDMCDCLPGYYSTSANTCVKDTPSIEEYSCEHGKLIEPETCMCDEGWEWKCGSCQPVCNDCDHGTCVSPGECECGNGYTKNDKGKCESLCTNGCNNGKCVSPDVCSCDPGWYKETEDGECKAHCDMNCDHGDCIAPNICDCHVGYQLYIIKGRSRCVPNRKDCKDPETCKCQAPYEVSYFRDDGSNCSCVGACVDPSSKCTKATCLFMNVAPNSDTTLPELDYDYPTDDEEYDQIPDQNSGEENIDDAATKVASDQNPNYEDVIKAKTASNTENAKVKREAITSHVNWIIGAVVVGILIVLIIICSFLKENVLKRNL